MYPELDQAQGAGLVLISEADSAEQCAQLELLTGWTRGMGWRRRARTFLYTAMPGMPTDEHTRRARQTHHLRPGRIYRVQDAELFGGTRDARYIHIGREGHVEVLTASTDLVERFRHSGVYTFGDVRGALAARRWQEARDVLDMLAHPDERLAAASSTLRTMDRVWPALLDCAPLSARAEVRRAELLSIVRAYHDMLRRRPLRYPDLFDRRFAAWLIEAYLCVSPEFTFEVFDELGVSWTRDERSIRLLDELAVEALSLGELRLPR